MPGIGPRSTIPEPTHRSRGGRLEILAAGFLPGALAGTQLAGLLFFLNPHLPFAPGPALRAVILYGTLLGTAGLLLHLPFTWRHRARARRLLPWTLTLVLAATAVNAWAHASLYAYSLPPGINRRLLKLAILLTSSAVVAFYTTLIHRLRRRRYGPRSTTLLAVLAVISIYVAFERREAFKRPVVPAPRATTVEVGTRPRALVVGVDAATLDAILPLAEVGRLPFLGRLLQEGAYGRLDTFEPIRTEPLWTTIATGTYPYRHGVVGATLYAAPFVGRGAALHLLPRGIGFQRWGTWRLDRRLSSDQVRGLALWQILPRLGVSTAVLGWPLTDPAPEGVDIVVSHRFFAGDAAPGTYRPAEIGERARLFRPRREEIVPDAWARFGDDPPDTLLDALAGDRWRVSLSSFLLEQDPGLELLFLRLPGLADVSEQFFGGYAAVHFDGIQGAEVESAAQRLSAYYASIDSWIAELWDRVAAPRLLFVVSTHGVEEARGWRSVRSFVTRHPPVRGLSDRGVPGVLLMLGDGVRPGTMLDGATLLDVAPTLLYGLGHPVADDFDGKVLTNAFEPAFLARRPLSFVPSYETLTGPAQRP